MLSYTRNGTLTRVPLEKSLDNQIWIPAGEAEHAEYIEAKNAGGTIAPHDTVRVEHGSLNPDEIVSWAQQTGATQPRRHNDLAEITGGFRLLIIERRLYEPCSFSIARTKFDAIVRLFNLPEIPIGGLTTECGISWYDIEYNDDGSPNRLVMIIRAAQKHQIGNYGLVFSYDFNTGMSTGILHGTGITRQRVNHYELWSTDHSSELVEIAKSIHQAWAHPLCLPLLVMQHHAQRMDYYCTVKLSLQSTQVTDRLGAERAGRLWRSEGRDLVGKVPVHEAKADLRKLTTAMSNLAFEAIWISGVSEWQCETMVTLQRMLKEITTTKHKVSGGRFVRTRISFLEAMISSIKRYNANMKENGQKDMSVLWSVISQVDNRLNAKMAAAAGRDSAAMKTLAFITTLFLPGTFIASIFSTGMFNWHVDEGSEAPESPERTTSSLFWVFWVVAIPLTILVAAGWRVWWNYERRQFEKDVIAEIDAVNG